MLKRDSNFWWKERDENGVCHNVHLIWSDIQTNDDIMTFYPFPLLSSPLWSFYPPFYKYRQNLPEIDWKDKKRMDKELKRKVYFSSRINTLYKRLLAIGERNQERETRISIEFYTAAICPFGNDFFSKESILFFYF